MNLFSRYNEALMNLLPYDGTLLYYGQIFDKRQADHYLATLLVDIAWQNDEAVIFGKKIITKRKVAWYADKAFQYTYSKITRTALLWTPTLLELKAIVEAHTGATYNSCLLNLYHDGNEGMAWHSDAEKDLKKHAPIASLSFGAARKFMFKHKTIGARLSVFLAHGSLLVMKDETQEFWLHRLPPTRLITPPRVNLTFRTIVQ